MATTPYRPAPSTSAYTPVGTGQADIPLVTVPEVDTSASIGALVKDATVHMSTLIRSEIELAKLEVTKSLKTALIGSVFFIGAAAIGLFALFFAWFVLAEVIAIWLPRWAAYLITMGVMLAIAGALVFLGLKKIKKVKKPERTIATLQETASTLKAAATHSGPAA